MKKIENQKNIKKTVLHSILIILLLSICSFLIKEAYANANISIDDKGRVTTDQYELANFAQNQREDFFNLDLNELTGRELAEWSNKVAVNTFKSVTCLGHITNDTDTSDDDKNYVIGNCIDIGYDSSVTIYAPNGYKAIYSDETLKNYGTSIAYYVNQGMKDNVNPIGTSNEKVNIRGAVLNTINKIRVNINERFTNTAFWEGGSNIAMPSVGHNYSAVSNPISTTENSSLKVYEVNGKTYIGPYKIKATGININKITVTTNDNNSYSAKCATKIDQNFSEISNNDVPTNEVEFYVMVDGTGTYNNIKSIKVGTSTPVTRIKARVLLLYRPLLNAQIIAIYNSQTLSENLECSLYIPQIKNGSYSIKIVKQDEDSNTPLQGAEFKLKINDNFKKDSNGTDIIYTTDTQGIVNIPNILMNSARVDNLELIEVTPPEGYVKLNKSIFISATIIQNIDYSDYGIYKITRNGASQASARIDNDDRENHKQVIVVTVNNKKEIKDGSYNIQIKKEDADNEEPLSGARFDIKINGESKGKFETDNNGNINIPNEIKKVTTDTILITELTAPEHYVKIEKEIKVYVTTKIETTSSKYVVDKIELDDPNSMAVADFENGNIKIRIKNNRVQVKFSGYVWEDEKNGKEYTINGIKDSNENFVKGLKVTIHTADKTKIIGSDTTQYTIHTNDDGYYEFTVPYYEKGYYIEFTYNGQVYQHTKYTPWIDPTKTNVVTSNATETEQSRDKVNKDLEIISPDTTASPNGEIVNSAINKQAAAYISYENYNISAYTGGNGLKNNDASNAVCYKETSEGINFGLTKREIADFALIKDVYQATVSINGYSQIYQYNKREGLKKDSNGNSYWDVAYRQSDAAYTREITEEDYNSGISANVTYKISIKNQSEGLDGKITEIVDYYDDDYEFVSARLENNGTTLWEEDSSKVKEEFDINNILSKKSRYVNHSTNISTGGFTPLYINIGKYSESIIKPQGEIFIYITFKVKKYDGKILIDNDFYGKENIAEIMGYGTYYSDNVKSPNNGNPESYTEYSKGDPAGRIDRDSNPGNVTKISNAIVEDDGDKAPYMRFITTTSRKLNGCVWEDSRNVINNSQKTATGNGIKEDGENKKNNITVELWQINQDGTSNRATLWDGSKLTQETSQVITDENGIYEFSGYIPGNYYVKFIYPDGSKYKSTTYNYTQVNPTFSLNNPDVLGNYAKSNNNYSYARDVYDGKIINNNGNVLETLESQYRNYIRTNFAEDTYKTATSTENNSKMQAVTGIISATIEKDYANNSVIIEQTGINREYVFDNVDFGIEEIPKSQLIADKKVSNVKVILSNNAILFDASGKGSTNVWWNDKENLDYNTVYVNNKLNVSSINRTPKSIMLTMDREIMYGATIKITYDIKVTNIGEVNYESKQFYYTGNKLSNDTLSKAKNITIIDYVGSTLTGNSKATKGNLKYLQSENSEFEWNVVNNTEMNNLLEPNVATIAKTYSTVIKHTFDKELTPIMVGNEESSSAETSLKLSQVISADEKTDDLTYNNLVEIVSLTDSFGRKTAESIVGNQSPSELPKEIDSDMSQPVVILPPFGQTMIYYVLGFSILGILIIGIIIIKKIKK